MFALSRRTAPVRRLTARMASLAFTAIVLPSGEHAHRAAVGVGDDDLPARPVDDLGAVWRPARFEVHVQLERAGIPCSEVVDDAAVEVGDDDVAVGLALEHELASVR